MKYRDLFEFGKGKLVEAGITEASLDARFLLEFVCGTDYNDLLAHGERKVEKEKEILYLETIRKRVAHIPLQYITGVQEFMGLEFKVNRNVLIPRQDTEVLVEEVLKKISESDRILDMCTGSGCILISLLYHSRCREGVAVDISDAAIELARDNAESLLSCSPQKDWTFLKSDLFEKVTGKFDIIVSNPPYIRSGDIAHLMEEVRDYEPRIALDGCEDGLYFYRKIVDTARDYLNDGGMLFFETGYDQAEDVCKYMELDGYREICVRKDLSGLNRVVYGKFEE